MYLGLTIFGNKKHWDVKYYPLNIYDSILLNHENAYLKFFEN